MILGIIKFESNTLKVNAFHDLLFILISKFEAFSEIFEDVTIQISNKYKI